LTARKGKWLPPAKASATLQLPRWRLFLRHSTPGNPCSQRRGPSNLIPAPIPDRRTSLSSQIAARPNRLPAAGTGLTRP